MLQSQLQEMKDELLKLKSQKVISVDDKLRIQKIQQSFESIFNEE